MSGPRGSRKPQPLLYRSSAGLSNLNISIEEMERSVCFICAADHPPVWAITECSHRVCSVCALRMRELYESRRCVMCKTESKRVVMVRAQVGADGVDHTRPFEELWSPCLPHDEKRDLYFADAKVQEETLRITRLSCSVPRCREASRCFSSKAELKKHVNNCHELTFCDICLAHKKVFPAEYTAFTRAELGKHQKSENGHPTCSLCGTLYYSEDELADHRRDRHEQCHICRRHSAKTSYYRDYSELEEHFRKEHFLCPEPLCLELKFVVFDNELEYKAHRAELHLTNVKMQRSAQKQFRRLDLDYSFGGSSASAGSGTQRQGRDGNRRDEERSVQTPPVTTAAPPPPKPDPLPRSVIRHLFYGEAISDLAQRLQSLNMYEQRNLDLAASLQHDYKLAEATVGSIKGFCRQFQKGDLTASELTLKLDAIMGHEKLEMVAPILVDLQLDSLKRMQLQSAIATHLKKMTAFPPLPGAVASPGGAPLRYPGESRISLANRSTPPAGVLRIRPTSKVFGGPTAGRNLDPSRNPQILLGGVRTFASLSSSSSSSPAPGTASSAAKAKSKPPPSFRQAIAARSSVGIIKDPTDSPSSHLDESEFPSLVTGSKTKSDSGQAPPLLARGNNIFARGDNKNMPESFVIGSSSQTAAYDARVTEALTGVSDQDATAATLGKKKKSKKGTLFMRYG